MSDHFVSEGLYLSDPDGHGRREHLGERRYFACAVRHGNGFSKLGPTVVFLMALIISMVLLAWALRGLPVGTGYAVWTGTGAVGVALVGMILLGESAAVSRLVPIGLIAVGIVWLALAE